MAYSPATFSNFLDALHSSNTEADFLDTMENLTKSLGFDRFAYVSQGQTFRAMTDYPPDWMQRYEEMNYQSVDPVLAHVQRERGVISWGPESYGDVAVHRQLLSEARDFGLCSGVTIPIITSYGRRASLTLAGDMIDASDKISLVSDPMFQPIVVYLDAMLNAQWGKEYTYPTEQEEQLTVRQRQILTWVAQGKTLQDVANILDISIDTVNFHTNGIKKRLGAQTLAHAVFLGMKNREITI